MIVAFNSNMQNYPELTNEKIVREQWPTVKGYKELVVITPPLTS